MLSQIEVAQIVAIISAAYPNFAGSKETTSVYYELLKDLPLDLLRVATLNCCAESGRKFAPSVGEIRGAVEDIKRQAQGVPTAIEDWSELFHVPVTEEYKRCITGEKDENGAWIIEVTPYKWSHPLVRKVAVMMGFPKFPDWDSESYERAAFLKVYEAELQKFLKEDAQIPEVTAYIEASKTNQLTAGLVKKLEAK